jgi:hypothetical protein
MEGRKCQTFKMKNYGFRVKIFYDHGDMLLLWCVSPGRPLINSSSVTVITPIISTKDGSERELAFLLKRLIAVTNGDEAKEVLFIVCPLSS